MEHAPSGTRAPPLGAQVVFVEAYTCAASGVSAASAIKQLVADSAPAGLMHTDALLTIRSGQVRFACGHI